MTANISLPGFAVVTGAASGIGQATAKALVQAGVSGIALLDISQAGLGTTHSLILEGLPSTSRPPVIKVFVCDVTSPESVENTYANVHSEFGRIDYSIHCAGVVRMNQSHSATVSEFDLQNNVNYRGTWLCSRAAIGIMRAQPLNSDAFPSAGIPIARAQRGAIVNIASNLAQTHLPNRPIYSASKAAVIALTKGDALDYALDRIRINSVLPGLIDTPMTTSEPDNKKVLEEGAMLRCPMHRFGESEEVADVITFLCSTGASFVTGAAWLVDGGFNVN